MTTANKIGISALILTLALAIGGAGLAINNGLRTEQLNVMKQEIEKESTARADGDILMAQKLDDMPDKLEKVIENQQVMVTKLDIIMHKLNMMQ
jgi:hypothetical protein